MLHGLLKRTERDRATESTTELEVAVVMMGGIKARLLVRYGRTFGGAFRIVPIVARIMAVVGKLRSHALEGQSHLQA